MRRGLRSAKQPPRVECPALRDATLKQLNAAKSRLDPWSSGALATSSPKMSAPSNSPRDSGFGLGRGGR